MGIFSGQSAGLLYKIDGDPSGAIRAFKQVDGAAENTSRKGSSMFQAVFGGNVASQLISHVTSSLLEGGKAVLDYSAKLEQTKVGFDTIMGGAAAANVHLEELKKLSTSTGLEFLSLTKMSQRLQGAGVDAKRVVELVKDIGNTAAATGDLTVERMEGIGVAISQVFSKGKVSAEEMEQLAERGIPAWRILSEAIGKTVGETRKMAEDGKITSDQFLTAFSKFTRMNFGDAMQKQANTFSGAMSKITNLLQVTAAEAFKPIYAEISKFASTVAKSLAEQQEETKQAGVTFGRTLGTAIGVGIESSGLGTRGFWEQLLFAGKDIGKAAFEWGREVARGARAGFESAQVANDPLVGAVNNALEATRNYEAAWRKLQQARQPATPAGLTDEEKAEAEKRRKAREAAFKQELQDRDANIRLKLEQERAGFDAAQQDLEKNYIERNLTEQNYLDNSTENIKAYRTNVMALIREGYQNDVKQATTDLQKANAKITGNQALKALNEEIKREVADIQAIVKKTNKENDDERKRALDGWHKALDARKELSDLEQKAIEAERDNREEQIRFWNQRREEQKRIMELQQQADSDQAAQRRKDIESQQVINSPLGSGIAQGLGIDLPSIFGDQDQMKTQAQFMKDVWADVSNSIGQSIGGIIDGLSAMGAAYLATGEFSAKAALQMLSAAALNIAGQALMKGFFELAEAAAAAARYDFYAAALHQAASAIYFKTAAIAGAIGVGLGLAARAAGGGSGGSAGGAKGPQNKQEEKDTRPISRASSTAFDSGTNPLVAAVQRSLDRHAAATESLAVSTGQLTAKVKGMSPDEVVGIAANKRPEVFSTATARGIEKNAGSGQRMRKTLGI